MSGLSVALDSACASASAGVPVNSRHSVSGFHTQSVTTSCGKADFSVSITSSAKSSSTLLTPKNRRQGALIGEFGHLPKHRKRRREAGAADDKPARRRARLVGGELSLRTAHKQRIADCRRVPGDSSKRRRSAERG